MTRDELIETMARAITIAHGERPFGLYDYSKYPDPNASPPHVVRNERTGNGIFRSYDEGEAEKVFKELTERHVATAALTAIEAAGYAVVPKQANTEMVIAGQETFLDNGYTHGELHDGTLKKAYAAMVAAATENAK